MLGYYIASTALTLYAVVWFGVGGLVYYDKEIVIYLLSISWLPQLVLNLLLQETFEEEKLCMPEGNQGEVLYGCPSLETQLFYSFITFIVVFNLIRGRRLCFKYMFGIVLYAVFIVWALWWTGNYHFKHLIIGAFVGFASGSLYAISIEFFLKEDFKTILSTNFMRKNGYYDSLCSKTNCNNKDNTLTVGIKQSIFATDD